MKQQNEVNVWSVTWGVLMAVLFSAAAAYLGLKVGQVFEAAIPIAIIAVGVSTAAKRNNALRENVIIQSIGACSGAVVAGAIFTLPAIYILQAKYPGMEADFLKIFIASLLGGVLGILFLIPFRKYFVEAPAEQFPFPEATATTQVLKSGEKGGSQARPLLLAGLIGGLYDFIVATFGWWNENVTSRMIPFGSDLADRAKLVFKNNTGAAVLGLGYIIGFRYALIITLGSLFVWWLVVPGMALLFPTEVLNQWNPAITTAVGAMSPEEIFTSYGKSIGIGAIAMAGIIGIIKSRDIIIGAVKRMKPTAKTTDIEPTTEQKNDADLPLRFIAIASIATLLITFIFTIVVIFRQKRYTEIKNDFINNMTHELKTPIASISLAAQMLNDPSVSKSEQMQKHLGGVIDDESKRLRFLVEKVLQMSMFDRKKAVFKKKELDLN